MARPRKNTRTKSELQNKASVLAPLVKDMLAKETAHEECCELAKQAYDAAIAESQKELDASIKTVHEASKSDNGRPEWLIVGKGSKRQKIQARVRELPERDEEGNPIMEPVIGDDGQPAIGEDGQPVTQPKIARVDYMIVRAKDETSLTISF